MACASVLEKSPSPGVTSTSRVCQMLVSSKKLFSVSKLSWPVLLVLSRKAVMGSSKRRFSLVWNGRSPSLFLFVTTNQLIGFTKLTERLIPREFFQIDFHFIFFGEPKIAGLKKSIIDFCFHCCSFISPPLIQSGLYTLLFHGIALEVDFSLLDWESREGSDKVRSLERGSLRSENLENI